jgi:hypothetical protein
MEKIIRAFMNAKTEEKIHKIVVENFEAMMDCPKLALFMLDALVRITRNIPRKKSFWAVHELN